MLLGRATRIQRFMLALPKSYTVVCRLGAVSSTGDPDGEIVHTGRMPPVGIELPTGPPASSGHRPIRRCMSTASVPTAAPGAGSPSS